MTLVAIIVQSDAVHVVTDGAGLMADGTMGGALVKAMPMPHLNMVVACRGTGMASFMAGIALCGGGSTFDEVKGNAPQIARNLKETLKAFPGPIELFGAGFSERDGPDAWMVASHWGLADVAPYDLVELGRATVFPEFEPSRIGLWADLEGPRPLDYVDELLGDVRRMSVPIQYAAGGRAGCGVGAFAQLTTVTRAGISTRVVRRWPDQVGMFLNHDSCVGGEQTK